MSVVVIGIACEDNGHFSAVTRLVDDSVIAVHGWLEGIIDSCRSWRGTDDALPWYKYDTADAHDLRAIELGGRRIAMHGHIDGKPLEPEAAMWRKVLALFCESAIRPHVVILARDLDGDPRRRAGALQVRDGIPWPFKVVLATAQPEIEAWRVAGFIPAGEQEVARLEVVRAVLSFDPTTESHRLTSHPNDAPSDAKRVLEGLCGDDHSRRDVCLVDRDLLRRRGALNGAAAFLGELSEHIVPAFVGRL